MCAHADSEMTVAGSVFDKSCSVCGRRVMVAPTGQRFLAEQATSDDPVQIVCGICYMNDISDPDVETMLCRPIEEHVEEAKTFEPNRRRDRN